MLHCGVVCDVFAEPMGLRAGTGLFDLENSGLQIVELLADRVVLDAVASSLGESM